MNEKLGIKSRQPLGAGSFFLNYRDFHAMAHIELNIERYPVCFELIRHLGINIGRKKTISTTLRRHPECLERYPYLLDLSKIEESAYLMKMSSVFPPENVDHRMINPALDLLEVKWRRLPEFIDDRTVIPEPGDGYVIVLKKPGKMNIEIRSANAGDLLALKLLTDDIDHRRAAEEGGVPLGGIDRLVLQAEQNGLILSPVSRIRRPDNFHSGAVVDPQFITSSVFTLQWHLTQACDLNCRHCYDREDREPMPLENAISILDDFYDFCREHHVFGQISFSGGNPMLYPHFDRLYREAASRGTMTAILGNPMPENRIDKILDVQKPEFYQVSLEGLRTHNDYIRGTGHYDRTIEFLKLLGEKKIYRMVMLTLTNDNMDQVVELAQALKGLTELFTFNRLSSVGRGKDLLPVPPDRYPAFLTRYMESAASNPIMGLKDSLFNLLRWQQGLQVTGGCAGHGCGAAFNFVALLSDGQVHACRKLPSPIGNIFRKKLNDIYHGSAANRFRRGSTACGDCQVRPVCGGCPAVSYGFGLDIFSQRDPYCFKSQG
jgi:selenobiotic family peptide radical SAM maturase